MFQFTRPWRARHEAVGIVLRPSSCFNSRARGGRDAWPLVTASYTRQVSIHAPVEGATLPTEGQVKEQVVSIHAPVEGATPEIQGGLCNIYSFNSRARGGRDVC